MSFRAYKESDLHFTDSDTAADLVLNVRLVYSLGRSVWLNKRQLQLSRTTTLGFTTVKVPNLQLRYLVKYFIFDQMPISC